MKLTLRIRSVRDPLLALALLLGFGGLIGCGEDAPTATHENPLVPAHAGPNTQLTVNNAQTALIQAFDSFSGSIPQIAGAAAGKPAGQQSIAIPDFTIDGRQSGQLQITNAQLSLGIGGMQTLAADIAFDDFSDDGQLFIGGPVRFELTFTLFSNLDLNGLDLGDVFGDLKMTMSGELGFSGSFNGTIAMDVEVTLGETGAAQITGGITLDGQTIELSGI